MFVKNFCFWISGGCRLCGFDFSEITDLETAREIMDEHDCDEYLENRASVS